MTKLIRSMPEILDLMRAKRDLLNISHETIDTIAGCQPGYTSKVLAPVPLRGLGYQSLGDLLGALAIGFIPVDDLDQQDRVKSRWQKRKRPQRLPLQASASSIKIDVQVMADLQAQLERRQYMKQLGSKGGKMGGHKGGKRRAKLLGKRARQRIATHAARMRWAKRATACAP